MSVTIRPYRRGGWEFDIRLRWPDGTPYRERGKVPVTAKSAARRWAEDRERYLLQRGPEAEKQEVPTLDAFAPRFLEGYAQANKQKPSEIASKTALIRLHLSPQMGALPLDEITTERVQRLKTHLSGRAPKTINNVLTVLNTMLRTAVSWGVIGRMPAEIRLLPVARGTAAFHDFGEYERLVDAAKRSSWRAELIVLLGGEAGLRLGEIVALEWDDVNVATRQLVVRRSEWRGHVTAPKGGRIRTVPMTARLATALKTHRHLRSSRVICAEDGGQMTWTAIAATVRRAAKRVGLAQQGVHVLRHTFCSHLAMRGAPARAIQELAGHRELSTTLRYMHLSPAALDSAIRLIDTGRGDIVETAAGAGAK